MTTHGTGSFGFKDWQEQELNAAEGGAKVSRASVTNLYEGEITGEGAAHYLMTTYLDGTTGTYTGYELLVGSIGGRSGSIVLHHDGTFDAEGVTATLTVVPGSGAGELRGLTGTGGFTSKHGQPATPYRLDFDLG